MNDFAPPRLKDRFETALGTLKDGADLVGRQTEMLARRYPYAAVAGAMALGWLAGRLIKRERRNTL